MRPTLLTVLPLMLSIGCKGAADDTGEVVVDTGNPAPANTYRVDDAPEGTMVKAADLVISDDGVMYASWIDYRNEDKDTWVSRSTDGGVTWEASVRVDGDDIEAMAGNAQQAYLLLDGDTLYVTFVAQSYNDAATIVIYESPTTGDLSFSGPTAVGVVEDTSSVAYGKPALAPDGDVWVAWQAYQQTDDGEIGFMTYARASNGYEAEFPAAEVDGLPCECCRLDLQFNSQGDALMGYRNNIDDVRDQFVLVAEAGTTDFSHVSQASSTYPEIGYCPSQGPRFVELSDGTLVITWSDDDRVHTATSDDGGRTWGETDVLPSEGVADLDFEGHPTIAVDEDDALYVTMEMSTTESVLLRSEEGLQGFAVATYPQGSNGSFGHPTTVRSHAGITAVIGIVERESVWVHVVE